MIKKIIFIIRYLSLKTKRGITTEGFVYIQGKVKLIIEKKGRLTFGKNVVIKNNSIIYVKSGAHLKIGQRVSTGHHTEITCGNYIKIGSDVMMGAYTYITDADHEFSDKSLTIRSQPMIHGSVTIGDDVWIGRGAFILKNSVIGKRTVIAANAVVTKKFKNGNAVIGGVPAKLIKAI